MSPFAPDTVIITMGILKKSSHPLRMGAFLSTIAYRIPMIAIALLITAGVILCGLLLLLDELKKQQTATNPRASTKPKKTLSLEERARIFEQSQLRAKQAAKKQPPPPAPAARKRRHPKQFDNRLVGLLLGDHAAADRLVQQNLDVFPAESEKWCYEKALYDLMRDRL